MQFAILSVFRLLPSAFCLLLFSVFSVVNAFAFQSIATEAPDSATVLADTVTSSGATARPLRPKSPHGAAFRSMALPGWGQFYNGRPIKGGIIAASEIASLIGIVARQRQLNRETRQPGFDPAQPRRNVFIFTTIGLIFYSAVDAYVDAHLSDNVQAALGPTWSSGLAMYLRFPIGRR